MRSLAVLATLTVLVAPAAAQNAKAERAARAHYQKAPSTSTPSSTQGGDRIPRRVRARPATGPAVQHRPRAARERRPARGARALPALPRRGAERRVADEARELRRQPRGRAEHAGAGRARGPAGGARGRAAAGARGSRAPAPPRTEPASPATGAATGGEITSTTSAVASPVRGRLRAGGLAGVTLANIAYDDWNGSTRVGLAAGAFASYRMVPAFAVRLEAAYVQSGTGDDPDFEEFWHTDFIQAALLAQGSWAMFTPASGRTPRCGSARTRRSTTS